MVILKPMRAALSGVLIAGWLAVPARPAWSDGTSGPWNEPRQPPVLPYHLTADLSAIALSVGVMVTVRALDLGPTECRWCERSGLNRTDRWFRDSLGDLDGAAMDATGGVATALLPFGTIGLAALAARREGRGLGTVGVDSLIILESTSVALAVTTLVKVAAGRQRPYTLDLPAEEVGADRDQNASFFSGHSALAFSLAVSAGTVASMRRYRLAPAIWAVGLSLASVASFSRLTGDEHFFTDVVAGAVAGSAIGLIVPSQFHRARPVAVRAIQVGQARGLAIQSWF